MNKTLNHLAIIMDGNARWAKQKGLAQFLGHQQGVKNIKQIITTTIENGIKHLSLYAFSAENWHRSSEEVKYLITLLEIYLKKEVKNLHKNNIRIILIGDLSLLNNSLQQKIKDLENLTQNNANLTLYIAFSYGGKQEIIAACQKIIDNKITKINIDSFKNYLYFPNMPDVDLLIRTGGEYRISNFLLWQSAYAELYFSKLFWPDFDKNELNNAINEFYTRSRNFGKRN